MIKNYFSDITDLFLAVKKEENIQINEEAKAKLRGMLQAKIAEMKNPAQSETANRPIQSDDSAKQPFWSTWKYQLFGVPASLFALVLIVFVTSNLKVSIPKEDFSPTRENITNTEIVETTKQTESDRPLVKTAPGLLVIDFSEENSGSRSLNKTSTKQEEAKFETPKIEYNDDQTFVLDEQNETVAKEITADWQKTTGAQETTDSLDAEIPSEPTVEPTVTTTQTTTPQTVTTPITQSPTTPITVNTGGSPEASETLELPETSEILETLTTAEINKELIPEIISPKVEYPIYTYKDESLKTQDAFTKESLAKLTKSKTPESVTVYYVEKTQVVVEIEEDGITKWYLFDNINGTWTISRYEKFVTDNVVK